ncbi:MAG: hypothetical protein KJ614_06160 [Gammaproteobacteria bacterium]|uniref:hypothetical protein n=1 Tax=Rhodoferax sp. TaxID=50421 RepID=UPI00178FDFEE|nr:hypothetical protein [Rhodoferax sp.]MBU3898501.1 hypothetical protein [Gammaproteobacteria bacterium]MBA3058862.1 hypothetical protein [Rhodoferax sp.]MBU3997828.1 hypothetical protein [Gammaproteobacteria bacterium]MBU4079276.1 hypothetical protein [Gammaproteobacteria bacterium]MBU4115303.1 hypothetical protein [Gammaproteobacteria bacterium]
MGEESVKTSNELIRWLKMLALAAWARIGLASIMLLILVSALGLFFWVPAAMDQASLTLPQRMEGYQSCFFCASKEGYIQSQIPLHGEGEGFIGLVFIKTLGDDFLLEPARRLYVAQDAAFFIRALLNVEAPHG